MRRLVPTLAFAFLAGCAGEPEPEPPPPPPAPTVADFAGTWSATNILEGTPDPVPSQLIGGDTGADWVMVLESRDPIPLSVSMQGDSLVVVSQPYESVLRTGVIVTVRAAGVLQDGQMVGKLVATYDTAEGQELVTGTFTATRTAP